LDAENIQVRKYFDPPLHRMKAYAECQAADASLPITEKIAENIICLPIHTGIGTVETDRICAAFERAQKHAAEIADTGRTRHVGSD